MSCTSCAFNRNLTVAVMYDLMRAARLEMMPRRPHRFSEGNIPPFLAATHRKETVIRCFETVLIRRE
eukprot:scaffold442367_cov42-Prasinocladus_malaysianus.AAC.1